MCSFDETAESSYRTPQTFSLNFRRMTWNFSEKKITLLKIFPLLNISWRKSAKFSISSRKICKSFSWKIKFSTKTFCTHKLQFWQTFWSFCASMPEFFPHSPKTVRKLINFCRKKSPIKNLHWTHRMQFWQPCRKIFAAILKSLCLKSKNKQTVQKICFQKTTLPNISPGHLKTVLKTQPIYFRQKSEMFTSKSGNNRKFWRFCQKEKYFFKNVLWTQTKQFWPPCQKICTNSQTFSLKVR